MKRIVFVTHENLTKTAVSRAMLEDVAMSLTQRGFQCSIISASDKAKREARAGISYMFFRRRSYGKPTISAFLSFLSAYRAFFGVIRSSDVFYFRSYPAMLMMGLPAKLWRKRVIFDTRGLFFEELYDSGLIQNAVLRVVMRRLEMWLLRISDLVICVTESQLEYYVGLWPKVVAKAAVIYNGSPRTKVVSDQSGKDSYNFVYVGSLVKWHSPSLVLAVCTELLRKGVKFHLDVLTPDPELAASLFSPLGANVSTRTHDFRNQPIRYDVGFCFISGGVSKQVCFPVKFAEYVNSGTPVIASDNVDKCRDLVERFECGLLVNLEESPESIALSLLSFLQDKRRLRSEIQLPSELSFDAQIEKIVSAVEG